MARQFDRIFAARPASYTLLELPVTPLPYEGGLGLKRQVPLSPRRNGLIYLMPGVHGDNDLSSFALGLLAGGSNGAADLTGMGASARGLHGG